MDVSLGLLAAAIAVVLMVVVVVSHLYACEAERAAAARAEALLRSHLSARELAQLQRTGILHVASRMCPGRVYAVRANGGRVSVLQDGLAVMELCVRPRAELPGQEHVLAHKLMIEGAEDEYTRRANVMWRAGQATVFGRITRLD